MDPALVAALALKGLDFVLALIESGAIGDADLDRIAEAVSRRKAAVAAWDAESPDGQSP